MGRRADSDLGGQSRHVGTWPEAAVHHTDANTKSGPNGYAQASNAPVSERIAVRAFCHYAGSARTWGRTTAALETTLQCTHY